MKIAMALLLVAFTVSAHAELLAPKGAKGQLNVEYVFVSSGGSTAAAKDVITKWRVRRVVDITAHYSADAPAAVGTLHTSDTSEVQSRTKSAAQKLQPMVADVHAVAAKCGVSLTSGADISKAQEACIEKGVSDYGNNMEMTPDIKSAGADIAAASQAMKSTRYQLWQNISQSGTYQVDEEHHRQVFELTCTAAKTCKRSDVRKGGGPIPTPPGASSAGFSMLEVDSVSKDMVIVLPVPLAPLTYTQTVTTNIPDETGSTKQSIAPLLLGGDLQRITVSIPGSVASLSGTKAIPVKGAGAEGGTLTVNWKFTRL
jgi:hypothetical protein